MLAMLLCFLQCCRFAGFGPEVVLRGLGDTTNNTNTTVRSSTAEGDILGKLYDDGKREHDDRYAGDGLYTNKLILEFAKKEDVAVYKEFYVSLLQELVSSTVEIAGTWGSGLCAGFELNRQHSHASCQAAACQQSKLRLDVYQIIWVVDLH
jgi:hypothetical protein